MENKEILKKSEAYPKTIDVLNNIIKNSPRGKKEFIFFIPANCPFDKDECRSFFESHFKIVKISSYYEKFEDNKLEFLIASCEEKRK